MPILDCICFALHVHVSSIDASPPWVRPFRGADNWIALAKFFCELYWCARLAIFASTEVLPDGSCRKINADIAQFLRHLALHRVEVVAVEDQQIRASPEMKYRRSQLLYVAF